MLQPGSWNWENSKSMTKIAIGWLFFEVFSSCLQCKSHVAVNTMNLNLQFFWKILIPVTALDLSWEETFVIHGKIFSQKSLCIQSQCYSSLIPQVYDQPVTLQAINVSKSKFSSLIFFLSCNNSSWLIPSHPSISAKMCRFGHCSRRTETALIVNS